MARIKIKDLAKDKKISKEGMKKVVGGSRMDDLFNVWKTNISETNSDLDYFLNRLAKYNEVSEASSDYIQNLNDDLFGS